MSNSTKKIPGQNDPIPVPLTPEQEKELVLGLLRGETEPANDMAKFVVGRLREIQEEGVVVDKQVEQLSQKLNEAQARRAALKCQADAYLKDLVKLQGKDEK